jgi:glutathione gamma-glutamylcysteinyltransferase
MEQKFREITQNNHKQNENTALLRIIFKAGGLLLVIMAAPSFFMRPLPTSCIPFSSPEGRTLLAEALPTCPAYFSLIEQFHTQNEPAWCGLSTLVMVLNALRIDPGRKWKGPWRWFHEGMLDCCVPPEVVKEKGMSLDQFVCLAACNGASPVLYRPAVEGISNGDSSMPCDEETFRCVVRESCSTTTFADLPGSDGGGGSGSGSVMRATASPTRKGGSFVVVSYHRGTLGQTGSGHFRWTAS